MKKSLNHISTGILMDRDQVAREVKEKYENEKRKRKELCKGPMGREDAL